MTTLTESNHAAENSARVVPKVPEGSQILIVGDDPDTEQLEATVQGMGIASKTVRSMTQACECLRAGHFQAVLSKPLLSDGSWRRLTDMAYHYDLGFEVVLVARDFDLAAWAEALNEGAFDVLDAPWKQPVVAAEVVGRAVWAAYLKGAGPNRTLRRHQKAA